MSKFSKKAISIALTTTTAVWMSGAMLLVPVVANAQSTSDLQAQIAALLAQIQALQAQLGSTGGATTSTTFTRDLTVGSTGSDVMALQQFLNAHGAQVAASGAGSPGSESTYFGGLTKAALGRWQGANGVSPTAGYFGPITRAKVNALGGGVATGGGTTGGTTGGTGGGTPVPAPATGLAVSLSANNPAAGSLISSASSAGSRIPVLAFNLTAGNAGGVTVNQLQFKKNGYVSDNSISNAYLIEGGKVLVQYSSIANGLITFTGLNLGVNAGQTRELLLAIDPATGLSAGNTVSFSLASAAAVAAVDNTGTALTTAGNFPINGSVFTVTSVSNPSIASLAIASSSVGTSVYAGTQNVIVSQWTITGSNSITNLKSINFKVIGSATKTDLKNVKLYVNGVQVGATLPQVASDGNAFFNLASAPVKINTGSNNMQLFADISGSPSYTFQFELLNSYDVEAIDSIYNVPVAVTITGGSGVAITILQGALTVSLASNSPTTSISRGGSSTPIAKFTIYAAGEPVKVKWLGFSLIFTGIGGGSADLDSQVKNVTLVDDAGNQIGSTIASLITAVTCTDTTQTTVTSTASNCFGSSGSPINYIIPANTTRVLTLSGDIQSGATFTTITGKLVGNTSNLLGTVSNGSASSGAVTGSARTLSTTALTVAQNVGIGTQTLSKGQVGATLGSYSLTASSAEGVNLTSVTILTSASSTNFQNLKLMIGGTQIGTTQPSLSASGSYTFSGAINVPASQSIIVNVVADVLTGTAANTYPTVTTLNGCSGSGANSWSSITCSAVAGQSVVVAGQSTLTLSADSTQPAAGQLVMGTTGATLAGFRFGETSNIEDIKITDIYVMDAVASTTIVKTGFGSSLTLSGTDGNGAAFSANSQSPITVATTTAGVDVGYYYKFSFTNPVIVKQAASPILMVLKGNVSSYSSSGGTDNTSHTFKIAGLANGTGLTTGDKVVVALGATSNQTSTIATSTTANSVGNAQTLLRGRLSITGATLGIASGRNKTASDELASITFSADSAGGAVQLNTVTISFTGTAMSTTTNSTNFFATSTSATTSSCSTNCNVWIQDVEGATSYILTTSTTGGKQGTATFNFAGYTVYPGTPKTMKLKANTDTATNVAVANLTQGMSAVISASANVTYTDSDTGGATGINLPASTIPVQIMSVSFVPST